MADLKLGYIQPVGADKVVVESKYVKGGYLVVATTAERDGLITEGIDNIIEGSLCYCQADDKMYIYTGTAWVEKKFDPVVDQTYGPTSTNAQSGTAVAGAISGKANLTGGNTFSGSQIVQLGGTSGAKFEVSGSGSNQAFVLTRAGGAQCVLEAGGSIGLFGTKTNHPIQVRTNYANRMTIGTDGSVVLATDVAANSDNNQVATTKWVNAKGFLTEHQDISGKEDTTNKTTTLSSSSTDTQYPSAKVTYDMIQDVREIAEGKNNTYVVNKADNPVWSSTDQDAYLIGVSFVDSEGRLIPQSQLKVGDNIYVKEIDAFDRWVSHNEVYSEVSDLTGTTWVMNDTLSGVCGGNWVIYNINTTVDNVNYTQLATYTSGGKLELLVRYPANAIYQEATGGWVNANYKTITFTGGTDATNTTVINWIKLNGTLQSNIYKTTVTKSETTKVPITSISKNGTTIEPINGNVNIEIPTDTSDLNNDSGFITKSVNNLDNYLLKEQGKGWSTNDYTTTEKNKLNSIETGAEVNVQADWSVTDSTSDAFIRNKPTIGQLNTSATTAQSTSTSESFSNNITLHQVAKTGNADKVGGLMLNDQAMAYTKELTTEIGIGTGCLAGTMTESEIFALTGQRYGQFYYASDTNKVYRRHVVKTDASASNWRNDTTKYNEALLLANQLQDEPYIYVKIKTGFTYYSKLAKFFVYCGYDNISGSTTITGYCRQRNKFFINACNYNGNNLLGVYQPSANTDIYYLKLKRYASTNGASNDYSVTVKVMTNFNASANYGLEFIGKDHAEYAAVNAYDYYSIPADGISCNDIKYINGTAVPASGLAFTDASVKMTNTYTNTSYPILFKNSNNNNDETGSIRFDSDGIANFSYNPSTNTLKATNITATTLNGVTIGASPKFTDTHHTNYLQIKGNNTEAVKFTQDSDKTLNIVGAGAASVSASTGQITITATGANNGTLTINQGGSQKGTFTADQSGNTTIDLTDNDTVTTLTQGSGIALSTSEQDVHNYTVAHSDTSSQASVINENDTVIQTVKLDEFGHVTELASKTFSFPTPIEPNDGKFKLKINNNFVDTDSNRFTANSATDITYDLGANYVQDSNYVHTDNNFTNTYKSNIEANNAKVSNVQSDWNATSGLAQILNKPSLPTKTSDLTNDGADGTNPFITLIDVPQEFYQCTYGTTTYADITTALAAGKHPFVIYTGITFAYLGIISDKHYFSTNSDTRVYRVSVDTSNTWGYNHDNFEFQWFKTQTLNASSTAQQYPSAKATYDAIQDVREVAEGKKSTYIINTQSDITGTKSATTDEYTNVTAITGVTIANLKLGDNIYIKALDAPDYWVSQLNQTEGVTTSVSLNKLETTKVPITSISTTINGTVTPLTITNTNVTLPITFTDYTWEA